MNLAVGFFDGVHLGHQSILAQADAALTFDVHPAAILAPDRAPPLLMSKGMRLSAIAEALGRKPERVNDPVKAIPFTRSFAARSPADFAGWLKSTYPRLETVFCGPNWTFGAHGTGTADTLRALGVQVETAPFVLHDGIPVSSTRIRTALASGRIEEATLLLGHPHAVAGKVVPGKGIGRTLGFPTINVILPDGLVRPPFGVYAVATELGHGIANYGYAPTFGERAWPSPVLEVHLANPSTGLALPQALTVSFLRFIRPEIKFPSLDALKEQIARDIEAARPTRQP